MKKLCVTPWAKSEFAGLLFLCVFQWGTLEIDLHYWPKAIEGKELASCNLVPSCCIPSMSSYDPNPWSPWPTDDQAGATVHINDATGPFVSLLWMEHFMQTTLTGHCPALNVLQIGVLHTIT